MQRHFNKLLVILSYTCNNFGPLIKEKQLSGLEKKIEDEVIDSEDDEDAHDTVDAILKDFDSQFPDLFEENDD